uniref:Uncharacterized protein n=1 Tax=Quercus lobata TaxID=97700 RepID=A0A7N2R545_QUELO
MSLAKANGSSIKLGRLRVLKELIQGPNFNKPRAPQGLVSQLKSVKERPELQGKRKVIVASDVVEEESPEPPLATKNLDQPLSKSENHLTRLKQLVKIFLRLSHHKFNNQCAALQDTHGDQVGPGVFKFLEKSEIEEEEEEEEEEEKEEEEEEEDMGRSFLGGLDHKLSGFLSTSHEACSNSFSQQRRTFIQMRTVLKVVDNSGAKKVMCIQALNGKKGARLGDTIVASVKEAHPNGKVKKGKVVYGVVVRAAMQRGRCDCSEVKFDDNVVVLVDKQGQPIGTRVFGPVPHELRKKKHVKILTSAKHIA